MAKRSTKKRTWAKYAGHSLAHLQNSVDELCDWGFHKIHQLGDTPVKKRKGEKQYVTKAKKAGHNALQFLGSMGEEYYDKYEELKAKKKKRKK